MKRFWKGILSLGLAVAVCFGTSALYNAAEYSAAEAAAYTTSVDTYYSEITAESGTELLGQLHDLIVDTHKYYTSYAECKTYGPTTDPGLNGKGALEFYTHETIMSFSGTKGTWNREHVWCQSLSNGLWGTSGAGSDMHHIRPTESTLNSARGNHKYGYANGGTPKYSQTTSGANSKLGGYLSGDTFEPLDNVKGDVARIVMYVYTHYNNASNVGGTKESKMTRGNLPFTNVMSASNEAAAKQLLLEWNKSDPVDDIEKTRNEEVAKLQGNRNPFIDNESYADAIWGDGTATPVDPVDPVNPPSTTLQGISLNATSLTLTVGQTYSLSVIPNPSTASANAKWTSSNEAVASVASGTVTAKAAGTATITATSSKNSALKAEATVTVTAPTSSETATGKITITRDSFGDPQGYAFYTWSATNDIKGTAFIYGSDNCMQFNTKQKSYYLASTTATPAPIKSITVKASKDSADWKLLTSDTAYGEVSGAPTNGNDRGVKTVTTDGATWTVGGSDTYFALVRDGKGAAYLDSIEVEYGSGGSSSPQTIAINPTAFTMQKGDTTKLTATAEVNWTSSNTAVATVAADGTVTAVGVGSATVTATSKSNPEVSATATVTVKAAPASNETAQAFRDAVEAIDGNGTLAERLFRINAAILAYGNLSAADKTECADDIEALQTAIESYNATVVAYNEAADGADEAALKGAGKFH